MRIAPVLASLALVAPAAALQLSVPGTHADVPSALAAAAPGDTIVVHGGVHAPITITQPVRIVGSPTATFRAPFSGGVFQPPAISLAGPDFGTVTLANVATGGDTNGASFSQAGAGILGGGFDRLEISDSTISGHDWTWLTGVADGARGIDTSVADLVISRSTVRASASDTDDCYAFAPHGVPAIDAPGATVVLLDSTILGGDALGLCFSDFPGPPTCGCDGLGGNGGDGVVAAEVIQANTTVTAGAGSDVWDYTQNPAALLGTQPNGAALDVVTSSDLGNELSSSGVMTQGQLWSANWSTSSAVVALAIGIGTDGPTDLGPIGTSFLDLGALALVQSANSHGNISFTVPAAPAQAGATVTMQVYDPLTGLTNPVVGVLVP